MTAAECASESQTASKIICLKTATIYGCSLFIAKVGPGLTNLYHACRHRNTLYVGPWLADTPAYTDRNCRNPFAKDKVRGCRHRLRNPGGR